MSIRSFSSEVRGQPRSRGFGKRPSTLINRNITVAGHRTSVRLEPAMWDALKHICERERKSLRAIVTEIAGKQVESSLTASIRVYLMTYFRAVAANAGEEGAEQVRAERP